MRVGRRGFEEYMSIVGGDIDRNSLVKTLMQNIVQVGEEGEIRPEMRKAVAQVQEGNGSGATTLANQMQIKMKKP